MALLLASHIGRCGFTTIGNPVSCSYSAPSCPRSFARGARRCTAITASAGEFAGLPLELRQRLIPLRSMQGKHAFDVLGLGQAMVDFSGVVDNDYLEKKEVPKGGRRVISVVERAQALEELEVQGFELNAGGSLANSLAGCAVLGRAASTVLGTSRFCDRGLRVGMAGCIGDDPLGEFCKRQFSDSGVEWISTPSPNTGTGTVIVLTTDDAQRSFLSYPGTSDEVEMCDTVVAAIRSSRVLVIEGYLWEFPNAAKTIMAAIDIAHEAGTLVALTMADASVVVRHRTNMLEALERGADILFTNAAEAATLLADSSETALWSAQDAALELACLCPVVVVTDGSKGSYITALGEMHVIPPHWSAHGPVDTCGAGDAYAAGILYGYLSGFDLRRMGEFAAHTAACVISHQGPQLSTAHAEELVLAHTQQDETNICTALPSLGVGSFGALGFAV